MATKNDTSASDTNDKGAPNGAVPTTVDTTGDSALHLIKFGAAWCGACKAMRGAKTLEKFAALHPSLLIEDIDVDEAEDDASGALPDPDAFGVQHVPFFAVVPLGEDEGDDDDDESDDGDDDDVDSASGSATAPDILASEAGALTLDDLEELLNEAKRELKTRE